MDTRLTSEPRYAPTAVVSRPALPYPVTHRVKTSALTRLRSAGTRPAPAPSPR